MCRTPSKTSIPEPTGGIVAGLKINRTIAATHTLIGTLDREGNCQGASYSSDRGT